jgi:hypothetical protein
MSYTINLTDGATFATIADGTINTASSMVLVGKNYAGYGQFLDTNFMRLLENASNTTPPGAPLTGQLWWDKGTGVLKVYNGVTFKNVSSATASATAPSSSISVTGDLWYDTTNAQLKVYTGASWLLVGPQFTAGQGETGAIVATINDSLGGPHTVVELFVSNTIVAIVSKDPTFTPGTTLTGFPVVRPGITMSTTVASAQFYGTASNAALLGNIAPTQFLRNDQSGNINGTLTIQNNTGLFVGASSDFQASVSNSQVNLRNITSNGNLVIGVNIGGTPTDSIIINGTTGQVTIPSFITTGLGNIQVLNILNQGTNGTGNIGNATNGFNTIFAKATSAQYADIAERFEIDQEMPAGTVVELGGSAEITASQHDLSDKVFGVISTQAAYLMNSAAGTNATHPPVAMTGRVPVRVIGTVQKGDRLVSAGQGLARSAKAGEATWNNTIGRALESKSDAGTGLVEAIVTIK